MLENKKVGINLKQRSKKDTLNKKKLLLVVIENWYLETTPMTNIIFQIGSFLYIAVNSVSLFQ